MLSVDWVVARFVGVNGKSGGKFIEAPPQTTQNKENVNIVLKKFRLAT